MLFVVQKTFSMGEFKNNVEERGGNNTVVQQITDMYPLTHFHAKDINTASVLQKF
jgi:hypothetical protein